MDYDDLRPVSFMETKGGELLLLDRHNDVLAYFEDSLEREVCERIVQLINRP